MKRITLLSIFGLTMLSPELASASTESRFSQYISGQVDLGRLYAKNNINDEPFGFGFGGAVGIQYEVNNKINLRAEVEANHYKFNVKEELDDAPFLYFEDSYNHKSNTFLANFYIDRDLDWKLKPYGMIGLGMSMFEENKSKSVYSYITDITTTTSQNYDKKSFVYVFGAGFTFKVAESLKSDIGMRYMILNDKDADATILSAILSLRYTF